MLDQPREGRDKLYEFDGDNSALVGNISQS
jgi:hypothetical protein